MSNSKQIIIYYTRSKQLENQQSSIIDYIAFAIPAAINASVNYPKVVSSITINSLELSMRTKGYYENNVILSFDEPVSPSIYIIFEDGFNNPDMYKEYLGINTFFEIKQKVTLPDFIVIDCECQMIFDYLINYAAEARRTSIKAI